MKKFKFVTICCFYFFSATAQSNFENQQREQLLEKVRAQNEKLERSLNEDFNIPEYQPPEQFELKPTKLKSIEKEVNVAQTNKKLSIDEALDSKDPAVVQDALNRMKQKAKNNPMSKGVGLDNRVEYQEGQEEFNGSYYGFNPYKSVEENKKFYASMGFTMSYKYSDTRIYTFIFGGLAFIAILFGGFYFWNKRIRWKHL